MTARDTFRSLMAERRQWPRGSADWVYRTRAAMRLVWIIKGKPVEGWK